MTCVIDMIEVRLLDLNLGRGQNDFPWLQKIL